MLPESLRGPGELVKHGSADEFISENLSRYPQLDPDFVSQICFEHPTRFDSLLPNFNLDDHQAMRIKRSTRWVRDNVRYDHGDEVTFWRHQFDKHLDGGNGSYVFNYMIEHRTWPFPPVIIESRFAVELGAPDCIGEPFHLVEGTHRVSYLLRMLELGMVSSDAEVELIEISPNNHLNPTAAAGVRGIP